MKEIHPDLDQGLVLEMVVFGAWAPKVIVSSRVRPLKKLRNQFAPTMPTTSGVPDFDGLQYKEKGALLKAPFCIEADRG